MATYSKSIGSISAGGGGGLFDYLTDDKGDCPGEAKGLERSLSGVEDYLCNHGSVTGQALGKGAERMGLTTIDRETFGLLAEGKGLDGEQRIQTQNGKHKVGVEIMLSAPKWASALMAVASPEDRRVIEATWDQAVNNIVGHSEKHAKVARRPIPKEERELNPERGAKSQGSATDRVPAEWVVFKAQHTTARPTPESIAAGAPPDPHIHTHLVFFSNAWVPIPGHPDGGKWQAIDDYGIKAQAEQRLHDTEGEFARLLEDAGYRLNYTTDRQGRIKASLRDEGVSPEAIAFLSKNSNRAATLLRQFEGEHSRPPTQEELRALLYQSRQAKNFEAEKDPDWEGIVAFVRAAGIKFEAVRRRVPMPRQSLEKRYAALHARLVKANGLTKSDAVFNVDQLRAAVARCAVGLGLTLDQHDAFVQELLDAELVEVADARLDDHRLFTTKETLQMEALVASIIEAKTTEVIACPDLDAIDRAIQEVADETGITLDEEQTEMVRAICSGNSWINIEGWAGAGKTTALKAVVRAYRDSRLTGQPSADHVIAVSTARNTAQETGAKIGADRSDSIESFCLAVARGVIRPTSSTVIFLDESVMVDTARIYELLKAAGDAQIVCIGDQVQLQCIGAGGWYGDQVAQHGKIELTNVHRQTNPADVEALALLRTGKAPEALENLDARGRVHIAETRAEKVGQVIAAYKAHRDEGVKVEDVRIVLDGANAEIDQVNRILQQDRIARAELAGEGYVMKSETSEREWTVYKGDEVSFVKSYFDQQARVSVTNGTKARVVEIDHEANTVELLLTDDNTTVTVKVEHSAQEQLFGPSYAAHAIRTQGGEASIILAAPTKTTNLEAAYSVFSRCKEQVHVYLDHQTHGKDPLKALGRALAAPQPKLSATTQLRNNGREIPDDILQGVAIHDQAPENLMSQAKVSLEDADRDSIKEAQRKDEEQERVQASLNRMGAAQNAQARATRTQHKSTGPDGGMGRELGKSREDEEG